MMVADSWLDCPGKRGLGESYARHCQTLRGAIRHALVLRRLITCLPRGRQRILDVGGGDGNEAIALARLGHDVVLLDADRCMLRRAEQALASESRAVSQRVQTVLGRGEEAAA